MIKISEKAIEILKFLYSQLNEKSHYFSVVVNINTMADEFKITKDNIYLCLSYLDKKELIEPQLNTLPFGEQMCEMGFSLEISATGIDLIEGNI